MGDSVDNCIARCQKFINNNNNKIANNIHIIVYDYLVSSTQIYDKTTSIKQYIYSKYDNIQLVNKDKNNYSGVLFYNYAMNNRQTPLLISSCVLNSDNPIYEQADRIELSYYDFISENSVEFTINKTYRINKNNIHTAKF